MMIGSFADSVRASVVRTPSCYVKKSKRLPADFPYVYTVDGYIAYFVDDFATRSGNLRRVMMNPASFLI